MTTLRLCASCHRQWIQVVPDMPHTAVICPACQPNPTWLERAVLRVYGAIHGRVRRRVTAGVRLVALWLLLIAAGAGSMAVVLLVR